MSICVMVDIMFLERLFPLAAMDDPPLDSSSEMKATQFLYRSVFLKSFSGEFSYASHAILFMLAKSTRLK